MAKRGYKLQEFVAHPTNVNCLSIGKKACRLFITGGDDQKVNLWAIGKPTSLMSLCGHTSPVESVSFDAAEVLVLAGSAAGAIKLWDLEEAKMVRTLSGHRSNCTAVEFHPFGEFFASGSTDTNLKIWDVRKKGCLHTYKGHTRGISTIKFTPDGRWVVSGGYDNVVKVWDLTAGKLLHDFKFHEGQIRSLDFHPLEFLLATGSADRTVKFWDLETFELIGSARPEATGVCSITFHPDGRSLFCGLDDSLKVYSWEPVICHDSVDMGWSTLGDLCIHEGKLLGCSYYRNSVGVWVADISLIEPYVSGFVDEENNSTDSTEEKFDISGHIYSDKVGNVVRSRSSALRSTSPDFETKDIKNIYVDSSGGNPVTLQRSGSLSSSKVLFPLDSKERCNQPVEKENPVMGVNSKSGGEVHNKSFVMPAVVPRESTVEKNFLNSDKEAITFSKTKPGMLLRPAHIRRPSNSKNDVEKISTGLGSVNFTNTSSENEKESATNPDLQPGVKPEGARKSCEEKSSNIKSVAEKFEKISSPETPSSQGKCDESVNGTKGIKSVKIVNGVAVVAGRTRTLVERFERGERLSNEDQATNTRYVPEMDRTSTITTNMIIHVKPETDKMPTAASNTTACVIQETDGTPASASNFTPCIITPETHRTPSVATNLTTCVISETDKMPTIPTPHVIPQTKRTASLTSYTVHRVMPEIDKMPTIPLPHVSPQTDRTASLMTRTVLYVTPEMNRTHSAATYETPYIEHEMDRTPLVLKDEPQFSGRDSTSANDRDVIEDLMQSHDVFLSGLKSRLTKLQVVRHFWERNDIKGAINAIRKLPDHSVQADVIGVLMEKMEILTLDLFSYLLPVLVGLLDSKMERHANISLELLLKLVAVFGPLIRSTISAPRAVGVDLHAEQRLECCNQCSVQLQKIQQILPALTRNGGLLAKSALELNLVLQAS